MEQILLDGLARTVHGRRNPSYAQQLVCFVSADTPAVDESPVEVRLRADGVVFKRLERHFDSFHPKDVAVLTGVQCNKPLRADVCQQPRVDHCTLHDAVPLVLQRLTQHGEVQSGRAVVGDSCSPGALSATEF